MKSIDGSLEFILALTNFLYYIIYAKLLNRDRKTCLLHFQSHFNYVIMYELLCKRCSRKNTEWLRHVGDWSACISMPRTPWCRQRRRRDNTAMALIRPALRGHYVRRDGNSNVSAPHLWWNEWKYLLQILRFVSTRIKLS